MADLLRAEYRTCWTIYLSWDAASWHISKKLFSHLDEANQQALHDGFPIVKRNELLYAFGGAGNTNRGAGGQTLRNAIASTEIDAYKVGGSSGSTASATFTQSSHNYAAMVGTFKHQ